MRCEFSLFFAHMRQAVLIGLGPIVQLAAGATATSATLRSTSPSLDRSKVVSSPVAAAASTAVSDRKLRPSG